MTESMIDEYHKNRNRWTRCGPKQTNKKGKGMTRVSPIPPENKILNEHKVSEIYHNHS
jgi:hypothetical protein